jgi:WD40 repeat protein
LASGSTRDKGFGIWKLNDMLIDRGKNTRPWLFDDITHKSPVKALAWNPNCEGLLSTGGCLKDNIIRIWDVKQGPEVLHSLRCNSYVTSLAWRKSNINVGKVLSEGENSRFCEELISCHGSPDNEVKLW